ncbi:MAG TPA: PaaI family thioesterase [Caulobacteraceae bacterium]|nr:PaaI family thioesterase [Caulobacteraceae bacterium]
MSDRQARLDAVLAGIPYARFLGVQVKLAGDELTGVLPFAQHLVGNPMLPALHGGVIGAFLEMTAMAQLALIEQRARLPRPIGVTVEYLRPGRARTTYARAQVKRVGRRIANVHVEAWQDARSAPIATLRAHFLLASQ